MPFPPQALVNIKGLSEAKVDKVVEAARKMVGHAATLMVLWTAAFLNPCIRSWFILSFCTMHLSIAIP